MENKTVIFFILGIVAFTLWRNYGVIAKGEKLPLDNPTTNEEKELYEMVKTHVQIIDGQTLSTSFGVYEYRSGNWVKIKEIWDK